MNGSRAAMVKLVHPGTTIRINDNLAAFHCAAVRRYSDFGLGHMVPRMSELSIDTDAWVTAHNQAGEVCLDGRTWDEYPSGVTPGTDR